MKESDHLSLEELLIDLMSSKNNTEISWLRDSVATLEIMGKEINAEKYQKRLDSITSCDRQMKRLRKYSTN